MNRPLLILVPFCNPLAGSGNGHHSPGCGGGVHRSFFTLYTFRWLITKPSPNLQLTSKMHPDPSTSFQSPSHTLARIPSMSNLDSYSRCALTLLHPVSSLTYSRRDPTKYTLSRDTYPHSHLPTYSHTCTCINTHHLKAFTGFLAVLRQNTTSELDTQDLICSSS